MHMSAFLKCVGHPNVTQTGTRALSILFHMWRNFAYVNLHSGANDESTDMVSVILPPTPPAPAGCVQANQAPRQLDPPPHCSMLHGAMLPFIDPSRQCAAYGIWTLFQPCSAFRHVPQASPTGYRATFTSETQYRPFPHRSDNPRAADRNRPTNPAEAVQA